MAVVARSIEHYIGADPLRHGAQYAILRASGIAVWALIAHLIGVDWDTQRAAKDYELSTDEVDAAIAYYQKHKPALDAMIAPTLALHDL